MMYILLDIDGVMLKANSWSKPEILNDGFVAFEKKSVNALNLILSNFSSKIILSTSHKYSFSLEKWIQIFRLRGIFIKEIDRLSENINFVTRKDEILNWIAENPFVDEYIIIDDDKSLNLLPNHIKDKWIATSSSIGLTEDLANNALKIIEKNMIVL